MPEICHIDCETRSGLDIGDVGAHAYVADSDYALLIVTYAFDNGPVLLWEPWKGEPMPADLRDAADDPTVLFYAHSAQFERLTVNQVLHVPLERWRCSMAQAYAHALPGALDMLCRFLGVEADKRKLADGKALIRKFCTPPFADPNEHPAEWVDFLNYAVQDVEAARECLRKMPSANYPKNKKELELWFLDQRINDRGFAVDVDMARIAMRRLAAEKEELNDIIATITKGAVTKGTQSARLKKILEEEYGVELPNMRKDTLARLEGIKGDALTLLNIRRDLSRSSTSKYERLLAGNVNGRMYGTAQYCGAGRTRRWAGRGFQPLNLPRPSLKADAVLLEVEALKADLPPLLYGSEHDRCADALRSAIVAGPGKKLVVSDWSSIEGRLNAWAAGEQWVLDAYAMGRDMYIETYKSSFGHRGEIEKSDYRRQIGKVCLAGDSLVLCETGWKRLDNVTPEDRVWDGVEWAEHRGLVYKGWKPVVSVYGLSLTPDHRVWSGARWETAAYLAATPESTYRALASAAGSLSLPAISAARKMDCAGSSCSATVAGPNTWLTRITSSKASRGAAMRALRKPQRASVGLSMPPRSLTQSTGVVFWRVWRRLSHGVRALVTKRIRTTAGGVSRYALSGARIKRLFCATFRQWRGGTFPASTWTASTTTKGTNPATSSSAADLLTAETAAPSLSSLPTTRVYDLSCVGSRRRFLALTAEGPLLVHNCDLSLGYEGGTGALLTMSKTYGLDPVDLAHGARAVATSQVLDGAEWMWGWANDNGQTHGLYEEIFIGLQCAKIAWRRSRPATVQMWKDLRDAMFAALKSRGETFSVAKCKMMCTGAVLAIKLPSGGLILYANPRISRIKQLNADGEPDEEIKTRVAVTCSSPHGGRQVLYGGKVDENICQALGREILVGAMPRAEAAGYEIVLHVYDEIAAEVDEDSPLDHHHLSALICEPPWWGPDIPLAAEGFTTKRYKKD